MNISLIGMPASGKTTVSKELKKILTDYKLIDTDEIIVQNEKSSINDIFAKKGEKYFRILETETLKQVLQSDNQIISTGGGIIKSDENIKLLKSNSIVFYLKTNIETLIKRAKKDTQRPLLNDCDVNTKIKNLLKEREPQYLKAHYVIDTNNKSVEQITKDITEKVYEKNRC